MIEFEKHKTIGLLLSGGFDSALLLHLLCNANDNSHFILFTMDKPDGSVDNVKRIISNNNFNSNTYESVMIPYKDEYDEITNLGVSGREAYKWIKEHYIDKVDVLYSGNTTNPPIVIESRYNGVWTTRSPDRSGSEIAEKRDQKYKRPFGRLTKKDTVRMVSELKLDYIVNYSHSCTEKTSGRCNECWQCQERQWGFSENNIIDFGSN